MIVRKGEPSFYDILPLAPNQHLARLHTSVKLCAPVK